MRHRITRQNFISLVDRAMRTLEADDIVFDALTDYSRTAKAAAYGAWSIDGIPCPLVATGCATETGLPKAPIVTSDHYLGGFDCTFDSYASAWCGAAKGILEVID